MPYKNKNVIAKLINQKILKNIIFHIKLFHHFEFSRKKFFHKSLIFTQNIKKIKEKWTKISFLKILLEKFKHFRRHLE
jgi:hypothetical protein